VIISKEDEDPDKEVIRNEEKRIAMEKLHLKVFKHNMSIMSD
jgi:hypothetical protein